MTVPPDEIMREILGPVLALQRLLQPSAARPAGHRALALKGAP